MMTKQQIQNAISELKSIQSNRYAKYIRNFRRYENTPYISLSVKESQTVGYYTDQGYGEEDTLNSPNVNVIKSVIDTLTSKIAQSKVRPYLNCINGSFKDIQIVKQAQQYFDQMFDMQDVNRLVSEAFRDSCIFDTGVLFVDESTNQIKKALPWQVYFRPSEKTYGKLTRIFYEQKDYPVSLIPEKYLKTKKNIEYVTYGVYYDIFNKTKAVFIPELNVWNIESFDSSRLPFIFLFYSSPIAGSSSTSVVDMLNNIQIQINQLMTKISDAAQLNPANTIFVPQDSSLKVTQLSNRVGTVLQYKATPNMTSSPVTVSTPAFIDPQYMQLVEQLKSDAYEMVGISELSAQSQKPTGLNSGIALQTMENIESDRFETQLNQVIRAYVELTKVCIAVFDQNATILPEDSKRVSIQWKDIVEESNNMTIQFSGADALSKDPSTKLEQLQMLAQAGVLPASRISQFLEIPDLQGGYSLSNNAINAVMTVIDDCLERNVFDIPEYIPFNILQEEIINTQLSLKAADSIKNKADIDKLTKLYEISKQKGEEWTTQATEEMVQGVPEEVVANAPMNAPVDPSLPPEMVEQGDVQLPYQQNILTQENNMQPVDMDLATQNVAGNWNQQPVQGGFP